jgi:hypothetical protein
LFDRISLAANLGCSYATVRNRPLKEDVSFDELLEFAQTKILKRQKIWKQKKREVQAEKVLKKAKKEGKLKEKTHKRVIWQIRR